MRDNSHLPVAIVGQGLAGTLLAWQLYQRHQPFTVFDLPRPGAASRVAAGIVNPIIGSRLTLDPDLVNELPVAEACYKALSAHLGAKLYRPIPILRRLTSDAEKQQWIRRRQDPAYQLWLNASAHCPDAFEVNGGGWLDTRTLLDKARSWLSEAGLLQPAVFDPALLDTRSGYCQYQQNNYRAVIFCEGAAVIHNPWFKRLPWVPAKGDILEGHTESVLSPTLRNDGHWLLPTDQHRFRVGATWSQCDDDPGPDPEAKRALQAVATRLLGPTHSFSITGHESGLRPSTRDFKPVMGPHPEQPGLWVFNGFGARGVARMPAGSLALVGALLDGQPLPTHKSITRRLCVRSLNQA